jgi:hypothetical protein
MPKNIKVQDRNRKSYTGFTRFKKLLKMLPVRSINTLWKRLKCETIFVPME